MIRIDPVAAAGFGSGTEVYELQREVEAMAEDERRPLLDRVRALVTGQPFAFPYVTEVLVSLRTR